MQQQRRVHIFLYSDESDVETFSEAIAELNPDLFYILAHNRRDLNQSLIKNVEADLEQSEIPVDRVASIIPCDHSDMYDILGLITTIVSQDEHQGDSVRVNVSTGGRPAAIGATIGCMDVSTDAKAYYSHDGDTKTVSSETTGFEELATYPIDSPNAQQLAVMAIVQEQTRANWLPHKRKIYERAGEVDLDFMRGVNPDAESSDRVQAHRRLTSILDPLESDGFLEILERGNKKEVELTDRGRKTLRAFRHKIDPEIIEQLDGIEPHL